MYQDLHFYIDLDWTKHIESPHNYLNGVLALVDFAYQHKANVYFSEAQLNDFTQNCQDLNKDFSVSIGNKLKVILENAKSLKEQNCIFEVYFASDKTSLNHVKNYLLSSIQNYSKQVLLSFPLSTTSLLLVKSNNEFEKITISYLSDFQGIRNWIVDNSAKRNFNFSSKHGNSSIKAIPPKPNEKVSQLKCTNEEARKLLNSAIVDLREKSWCYNFDEKLKTFIVFPFEGNTPQNQFHAFHIEQEEWQKEIPASIRKFFNK